MCLIALALAALAGPSVEVDYLSPDLLAERESERAKLAHREPIASMYQHGVAEVRVYSTATVPPQPERYELIWLHDDQVVDRPQLLGPSLSDYSWSVWTIPLPDAPPLTLRVVDIRDLNASDFPIGTSTDSAAQAPARRASYESVTIEFLREKSPSPAGSTKIEETLARNHDAIAKCFDGIDDARAVDVILSVRDGVHMRASGAEGRERVATCIKDRFRLIKWPLDSDWHKGWWRITPGVNREKETP
ncbi:MAG: hypothetical protein HN348_30035 [Proteobacteria bacterium]|jgi:hypothetical protein|nr:hypothetical protein [Pseudomonadota bacterium]